jgi:hypothetical protein
MRYLFHRGQIYFLNDEIFDICIKARQGQINSVQISMKSALQLASGFFYE